MSWKFTDPSQRQIISKDWSMWVYKALAPLPQSRTVLDPSESSYQKGGGGEIILSKTMIIPNGVTSKFQLSTTLIII